jgi:hypothetical protein
MVKLGWSFVGGRSLLANDQEPTTNSRRLTTNDSTFRKDNV